MNEVTFRKAPATLEELNARLAVCCTEKSFNGLDLTLADEALPTLSFKSFFAIIQPRLPILTDITEDGVKLLQRQTMQLFPFTDETRETYKLFSLTLKTVTPTKGVTSYICHLSTDEVLGQFCRSVSEKPDQRLHFAIELEPKPKTPKDRAEKFQTAICYLLLEGRMMRICAVAAEVAARVETLSTKASEPVVYPEAVQSQEEFAYWLQLPHFLATIRSPEPTVNTFLALAHLLENRKPYHTHLRVALEFQISLMQLNRRIQVVRDFVMTIYPHSLLHEIRDPWKGVRDIVSPFGRFFIELFQRQHHQNGAKTWDVKQFHSWKKAYAAFKKSEKYQKAFYEYAMGEFFKFIKERPKPREWMEYMKDLGPQEEHESTALDKLYRTYDPHPIQTAMQFLHAQKTEEKAAPQELKGLGNPFPYKYSSQVAHAMDESDQAFSPLTDRFYDIGHTIVISEWTLHIVPAEIERGDSKRRGTILYAVKDGICFQRAFHPRAVTFLLQKFSDKSFTVDDFADLSEMVAAPPAPETAPLTKECEDAALFNPKTGIAIIAGMKETVILYSLRVML